MATTRTANGCNVLSLFICECVYLLWISAFLSRAGPMVWIEPEQSVVYEGESAEFTCLTNSTPLPSRYIWLQNGQIPNTTRWNPEGPILRYTNLTASPSYSFIQCEVYLDFDGVIQAADVLGEAVLFVKSVPHIIPAPSSTIAREGSNVTLACMVEGDYLMMYWEKNGENVDLDELGRMEITEFGLFIDNVSRNDAGTYVCSVAWSGGFLASSSTNLTVYYGPELLQCPKPKTIILPLYHSFTLHCVVDGVPPPSVAWFKDGKMKRGVMVHHNGTLHVESTNIYDGGTYHCEASNDLGTVRSREVSVTVRYPILNPPVLTLFNLTHNHMTVTWTTMSDLEVINTLRVSVRNVELGDDILEVDLPRDQQSLVVTSLFPYTVYEVMVNILTPFTSLHSSPMIVKTLESEPGDSPRNLTATNITNTSAILKWEEPATPNGRIRGYHIRVPSVNIHMTVGAVKQATVVGLVPYTQYIISVRAFTVTGDGPAATVTIRTMKGTIPPCVLVKIQLPSIYYGLQGSPHLCTPRTRVSRCMFLDSETVPVENGPICVPKSSAPRYLTYGCKSLVRRSHTRVTFLVHSDKNCVIIDMK